MFDRAIVHMDLDSFFVSVERLKNSSFKGIPLIIGGKSSRGVVASCSYEARNFGVHSAMPMKMALRLCPQATVLKGDMDEYSRHSRIITEIIASEAPMFEKSSIDEFYLDISGMDRFFGCYKWTQELRQKIIKESGLPISCGLSVNKLISKIGTGEAKPNGEIQIEKDKERNFIAPLSIRKIPGVGQKTYKKLSFMGVRQVHTLRDIPIRMLEMHFGETGRHLWNKANAIDPSPVIPYTEQKSMSKERTFHEDTLDLDFIRRKIITMVDDLSFELRQSNRLTSLVSVKIRYADFNTYTRQKKIPYTANNRILIRYLLELFQQLYQRRQLIRLIGVKFGDLVHGNFQIDLFEDTIRDIQLLRQMDHIRGRFGAGAIQRASSIDLKMKGKEEKETEKFFPID
ncbi:DNA polymerase IV [Membranihabitans maritimus]|uniref:DNA polymerase IV n=1 Tax=Membranihabitans maritimus TaxID=2904244 RepID=UPI001F02B9B2|nr:DNA polymerase IV [Membranihabitans maritimus]